MHSSHPARPAAPTSNASCRLRCSIGSDTRLDRSRGRQSVPRRPGHSWPQPTKARPDADPSTP
eukprot:6352229-Alexandrium_andersonii.AAC.1